MPTIATDRPSEKLHLLVVESAMYYLHDSLLYRHHIILHHAPAIPTAPPIVPGLLYVPWSIHNGYRYLQHLWYGGLSNVQRPRSTPNAAKCERPVRRKSWIVKFGTSGRLPRTLDSVRGECFPEYGGSSCVASYALVKPTGYWGTFGVVLKVIQRLRLAREYQ